MSLSSLDQAYEDMNKMKAWKVTKPGLENANIHHDITIPELKEDYDIVVKVLAVGLNSMDYKKADSFKESCPIGLGLDACGLVAKIGNKVDKDKFIEGKTLVLMLGALESEHGSFAEYTLHDSRYLSIVPEKLYQGKDLIEIACNLAALPHSSFTAYQIICNNLKLPIYPSTTASNLKTIRYILVSSGAKEVGAFCLQLLRLWRNSLPKEEQKQVKIVAICSEKHFEYVKKLGATDVINHKEINIVQKCMELTDNKGIDIFIDTSGGNKRTIGLKVLSFGGELVLSVKEEVEKNLSIEMLWKKSLSLHCVNLLEISKNKHSEKMLEINMIGDQIIRLFSEGKLDSLVTEKISFEGIQEALSKIQQKQIKGKIVARVTESKYKIY